MLQQDLSDTKISQQLSILENRDRIATKNCLTEKYDIES
jgi:hypothetical protein